MHRVLSHQHIFIFPDLFWRAPELLRCPEPSKGTQKGDVYAFAIILYEIIGRKGPFGITQYEPKDIIELVKREPCENEIAFRPNINLLADSELGYLDYIANCIQDCWAENPEARPDFYQIRSRLKRMKEGK